MSLADKAMIVTLTVSCWTARKHDRKVSEEVDAAHGASDAGRYNKLLIDKKHLDPLTSFASKVRNTHYKLTLPWLDNGGRLLPSKLFMDYRKTMEEMDYKYRDLVDAFIPLYSSTLIAEARKRLGTMYNPQDYPSGERLRSKFGIDLDFTPVPSGSDFRVEVGDTERARIQTEINERVAKRQADAMADAWERVRLCVSTIHARCTAEKPIIRDSLMENAHELVKLLPGLNINDDPQLTHVTREIANKLLVNVVSLRDSKSARKRVAEAAELILKQLPGEVVADALYREAA